MRVTTFNLLHDAIRNLAEPWRARRPSAVATLRALDPEIACLQEVSGRQIVHLREDLPEYELVTGIPSGPTRLAPWAAGLAPIARAMLGDFFDEGERCPILVRRERVVLLQQGSFRLRVHPNAGGQPSGTPHVVTWARVQVDHGEAWIYNTHLGLLRWSAARAAIDLRNHLDADWDGVPQILTGDMNATPGGERIRALLGKRDGAPPLHDLWLAAQKREGSGTTFDWGLGLAGPRIDYILSRPALPTIWARTSATRPGGVRPSDHLPLTVEVTLHA